MLKLNNLVGFGGGGGGASSVPATIEHKDSDTKGSGSTHTFTGMTLGGTTDDFYIVGFVGRDGSSVSVNSITVDGNACTLYKTASVSTGGDRNFACIGICEATGSSTGTITAVTSLTINRCGVGVWLATGLESATPTENLQDSGSSASVSIDCDAGGIIVGCFYDAGAKTWTGLTEDYDDLISSSRYSGGASDAFAAAEVNRTVSINSGSAGVMTVASFR